MAVSADGSEMCHPADDVAQLFLFWLPDDEAPIELRIEDMVIVAHCSPSAAQDHNCVIKAVVTMNLFAPVCPVCQKCHELDNQSPAESTTRKLDTGSLLRISRDGSEDALMFCL